LSIEEENSSAYTGLIRTFIDQGQLEHAREMIEQVPDSIKSDSQFEAVCAALDLVNNVAIDDYSSLQQAVDKNPDDHQARFDLAMALFSGGEKEQAIDHLVEIVRADRKWENEKARLQLIQFFDAMGHADPLTIEGRKKLSSVLFS
jgi:putative thioredoxin